MLERLLGRELSCLTTHSLAVGVDESHVRKTYQAQDPAPAGHLENRLLPAGHRQRRAAAGKNGDHLLGGRDETFPSLIGIAERLAGTSDLAHVCALDGFPYW